MKKILFALIHNSVITFSAILVIATVTLSFFISLNIKETSIINTMQGINFTLFGFSITSISLINSLISNNKLIEKVMKNGYFKRVQRVVWMILISAIISLILNIFSQNQLLRLSFSIPCILGALYCTYYILFLVSHKTMEF